MIEPFNENFKLAEFREFKNDAVNNSFTISPSLLTIKDLLVREESMNGNIWLIQILLWSLLLG